MSTVIDFNIFNTNSLKTLGLQDASVYDTSIPVVNPKVKIILPGFTTYRELYFQINTINIYNSNNLGLTNVTSAKDFVDLPDGIYNVEYSFDPTTTYTIQKKFLRIYQLAEKFEQCVYKYSKTCEINPKDLNKLKEIEFLIYSAVANANNCEFEKAILLYNEAESQIDYFLKQCL